MGIKTLLPFLKEVTEERNLQSFEGLVAAVDATCMLASQGDFFELSATWRVCEFSFLSEFPDIINFFSFSIEFRIFVHHIWSYCSEII